MTHPRTLLISLAGYFALAQAVFASPFCLPPGPADAGVMRAAPEECLLYLAWNGAGTADPKSENQTEQLLAEEEVKNFISKIEGQVVALAQQAMRNNPVGAAFADDLPALVKAIFTRPVGIYVSKVAIGPMGVDVRAGLVINTGDMQPKFAKLVAQLEAMLTSQLPPGMKLDEMQTGGAVLHRAPLPPGQPMVVWGFKDNYLLISVGPDLGQELVGRIASGNPPPWLLTKAKEAAVERPGTTFYLNVAGVLQTVQPFIPDPKIVAALDALGIQNVNSIFSVGGFDKTGMVSRTMIATQGEPQGLFSAPGKPLTAEDVQIIPKDINSAVAARLDLNDLLRHVLEGVAKVDPAARENANNALEAAEAQLGFSLTDDLLAALGDVWCFYSTPPKETPGKSGQPVADMVVSVPVRDRKRLDKSYPIIVKLLQDAAAKSGGTWSVKQSTYRGNQVYYVPLKLKQQPAPLPVPLGFDTSSGALMPCWSLTADRLVISSTTQGLKTVLTRETSAESLASRGEFASEFSGSGGPSIVTFSDSAAALRTLYPALQAVIPLASIGLTSQGINFQIPPIPALATLEKHARPSIFLLRKTPDGLVMESHDTVPVMNTRSTAVTGVAVALLLPAVQAAREAARRNQSNNNLKQIGLAMQNHADVHKEFPAAANYDKQGKPLLSWRVHVLPYIEQQELYKSFKLDEPWDSPNNKALIARMPATYRNPNLDESVANEGKTNYLAVVGEQAMIQPKKGTTFGDIKDGTSNTISVVEAAADRAVIWTKPDDWSPDEQNPMAGLVGFRPGIIMVLFGDGHTDAIPVSTAASSFKAMLTRSAGDQ